MMLFEKIINTIAITVDNTFVGTLFAGIIITFLGLKFYYQQKELDISFSKRKKFKNYP